MITGLESQHQDVVRTVARTGVRGLLPFDQTRTRGIEARLGNATCRLDRLVVVGEPHADHLTVLWSSMKSDPSLCDDPERAFRSEEETIGIRSRARDRKAAGFDIPSGRDDPHAFDVIVDLRIDGREMSCGACRDPPAKRGEFPGLKEEAQRQTAGLELSLEMGAQHAGLNARRLRGAIDLHNLVEVLHVDRDGAAIAIVLRRIDAADHACAAAVRNGRKALVLAPAKQLDDVPFGTGIGHRIRGIPELAAHGVGHIDGRCAVRVIEAVVFVRRADGFEGSRRLDARGTQIDGVLGWKRHGREIGDPEQACPSFLELRDLLQRNFVALIAPPVKLPAALLNSIVHLTLLISIVDLESPPHPRYRKLDVMTTIARRR